MRNKFSNQEYVHVFDCESITFKAAVNIFERMEISEYIYECVVLSYKKHTMADAKYAGHSSKIRGEAASSNTFYNISESSGKRIKVM